MRPRPFVLGLLVLLASAAPERTLSAQTTPEQDAVYAVVTKLFDAMRTRDTASMRASFAPGASLQSLTPNGVRSEPIDAWIGGVASAPEGRVLDERLANPVVQVNGALATVWVEYWFYVGEQFSHCGVDAFILARRPEGWKVVTVADTRVREGCPPFPGS